MSAKCDAIYDEISGNANPNAGLLGKAIGCLQESMGDVAKGMKNATTAAGGFVGKIGQGATLWGSIADSVSQSYNSNTLFLKDLNKQYQLAEKLAQGFKDTSVQIGISKDNQAQFGDTFMKSVENVQLLGGSIDDVKSIYTRFASQSGRIRILGPEEVNNIYALEKATGLAGYEATELAERFDLMGVGTDGLVDNINKVVNDSQRMGLNSAKVTKTLSDNFKQMQNMSFRGGVKGMTEMAKLSVKMRMEVSEMLGMADKFYEPEAAIEASANLQMLGGDVAAAFGDPIQMMYEARNAPEELAKRVGEVTKNMMQFNKETGEFEMPPEARMQIQSMAESLGLNKDQIIDTARQMSKMSQIKMDIGGNMFDDDQQEKIASLAKFDKKDQKWKVDVGGEAVAVQDLNTAELEEAMKAPSTEQDAIMMTAKAAMTTNDLLEAMNQSFETSVASQTDLYKLIESQMGPTLKNMLVSNKEIVKAGVSAVKGSEGYSEAGKVGEHATKFMEGLTKSITTDLIPTIIDSIPKPNFEKIDKMKANIIDVGKFSVLPTPDPDKSDKDNDLRKKPSKHEQDFIMRKGQPAVSFTSEDDMFSGKAGGPIAGSLAQIYDKINQPIEIPKINIPNMKSPVDGGKVSIEPITGKIEFGTITIKNEDGSATSQMDLEKYKKDIETKIMDKVYGVMADNWDGKNGGKGAGVGSVPM